MYSFIQSQVRKAWDLFDSKPDGELHAVRIKLKNIKPFLKLCYTDEKSVFKRGDYSLLNRTETSIGEWHDRDVLKRYIYDVMQAYTDALLEKSCQGIIARISRKEELHLPGIIRLTDRCLTSIDR